MPSEIFKQWFLYRKYSLNRTKFSIYLRGPKLWKDVLYKEENNIQSYSLFLK